jgi:hypothetical protein
MRSPIGIVRFRLVDGGRIVWTYKGRNLFVNAGRPALAALLGGDTSGEFAAAVGFGTGSNAPTLADTALTAPAYYKALDGHSEDGSGGLTLNWSLTTADRGLRSRSLRYSRITRARDCPARPRRPRCSRERLLRQ